MWLKFSNAHMVLFLSHLFIDRHAKTLSSNTAADFFFPSSSLITAICDYLPLFTTDLDAVLLRQDMYVI